MKTKIQGMDELTRKYSQRFSYTPSSVDWEKILEEFGYQAIRLYLLQVLGPILFKLEPPSDEEYDDMEEDH